MSTWPAGGGGKMKFEAVLFDCDGVLVDSEPITNQVLRTMLGEIGWQLTQEECMRHFVGKALKEELSIIAEQTGREVDAAWLTVVPAAAQRGADGAPDGDSEHP